MVILSENDMFEVKIASLLADYDRETITNLYQPIIGYTAIAIYYQLISTNYWLYCYSNLFLFLERIPYSKAPIIFIS